MPDPSIYSNMYLLNLNGNTFTVPGDTPAQQDVQVKDDIQDGDSDRHTVIGDIPNDQFDIYNAGDLTGSYKFVSVATIGGDTGFIAQNESSGAYYFLTNDTLSNADIGSSLTEQGGPLQVCFMPGTMIATPTGERAVETLRIGDLVTAVDGRAVAVRWIGRQTVAPRFADELRLPIRIRAGALGENVPARDLLLSPDHALFVDGILAHAGALVNGSSIVRERHVPAVFTYYHLEAEEHALILAEQAPAETFIDNVERQRFDNYAEFAALYPDGVAIAELQYPRAKAYRQVPVAIRQRLANRAGALGGESAAAA